MPLYEYQCEICAHRFEVIQKFSDAPIEICPRCGEAVRKLLSSPAIQFKGSGWYITDYARAGKSDPGAPAPAAGKSENSDSSSGQSNQSGQSGGSGGSGESSGSGSSGSSDSKTESKSETKTETKTESPKPSSSSS